MNKTKEKYKLYIPVLFNIAFNIYFTLVWLNLSFPVCDPSKPVNTI